MPSFSPYDVEEQVFASYGYEIVWNYPLCGVFKPHVVGSFFEYSELFIGNALLCLFRFVAYLGPPLADRFDNGFN